MSDITRMSVPVMIGESELSRTWESVKKSRNEKSSAAMGVGNLNESKGRYYTLSSLGRDT